MRHIIVLFCLLGGSVFARELTLDQAVVQALAGNKDLAASSLEVDKAEGRVIQAGQPRNPSLEISARSDLLFGNEGERGVTLGLSQAIPRKDRLRKAREAASLSVEQRRALVRDTQRQLVGEVQTLFVQALNFNRQAEARQRLLVAGEKLAALIEQRYQRGEVPQTDIAPIRIENAKLAQEQRLLLAERTATELRLKRLLGLPADEPLVLVGDPDELTAPLSAAAGAELVAESRPDYEAARAAVNQADAEVRVAKVEAYDDFTVGVTYEGDRSVFDAPVGAKRDNFLGASISIPLPVRNKNQGRIIEQQAAHRQAEAELVALRLNISSEVAQARVAVSQLAPVLTRYREELIPLAEQQFQAVQRAYERGEQGIAPVFQAQQQRFTVELDYLGHRARYAELLIALETALGTNPHLRNQSLSSSPTTP